MDDYAVEYTDFTTGLDVTSAIEEVPMMSVRACKNVDFDTRGMITTRHRYKLLKDIGAPIKAVFPYSSNSLGTSCLMIWAGTKLYKLLDAVTPVLTEIYTVVTEVTNGVTFWVPSVSKDCFIFNDGVNLKKYDGTSVTDLCTTKGKYLAVHKNRLCVSGNTAVGTEEVVYISKIGDPSDFSEGIAIRIPTWQGDKSIGLIEYMDKLYMMKYNSVQVIYGDVISNFTATPAINNIGCLAPGAFDTNGASLIFIGSDKVCYLFGGTDIQDISSQRVKPYFDNIDTTRMSLVEIKVYGAKSYITLPQLDGTTKTLIYDMSRENWTLHDLSNVLSMAVNRRGLLNVMTIAIGNKLYEKTEEFGVDDFSGVAVPFSVELRPVGSESAISIKKFRKMFLGITSASSVTVTTHTDLYPTDAVKPITPIKEEEVFRVGVKGRVLYVTITGGADVKLSRFSVIGRMKAPK